jgi:hypothetical protein
MVKNIENWHRVMVWS